MMYIQFDPFLYKEKKRKLVLTKISTNRHHPIVYYNLHTKKTTTVDQVVMLVCDVVLSISGNDRIALARQKSVYINDFNFTQYLVLQMIFLYTISPT